LPDVVGHARRIGTDAGLTTNEDLAPLLARVSAALGLPGNDPAWRVCGTSMWSRLSSSPMGSPRSRRI